VKRLLLLLLLIGVMGCTKHEVVTPAHPPSIAVVSPQEVPLAKRVMDVQRDSEIDLIMREVRQGDIDQEEAQTQLAHIVASAPTILADEARFRAVELQLAFDDPYADSSADSLFTGWGNHALIPYLHDWLAGWLQRHDDAKGARYHLARVIDGVTTPEELRHQALQSGMRMVAALADDEVAVRWLLKRMAMLHDDDALAVARMAAARSSLGLVALLHQQGVIASPMFSNYYQDVARIFLMRGDKGSLASIARWADDDIAGTAESRMIERWQGGSNREVQIGVLLPLSGRYARFGEQALHGVRMALSKLPYGDKISLVVADSGASDGAVIAAYRRLVTAGCVAVVGPVLADSVRLLAPYLLPNVPVIALTNQRELALLAQPLFVHSVGPQVQAAFLAERVLKQLNERERNDDSQQPAQVAVIASESKVSQDSAALFAQLLEADGAVIVHRLTVKDAADNRLQLINLRRESDDGLLLDELDEDLTLFIAETDLQPMIPPRLAAIYLPMQGRQVAQLAGQLAYVGLNQVAILGDSRWQDGHLLDDHGRYLAQASVVAVHDWKGGGASHSADGEYRQLWGSHAQSILGDVAFDSLVVVATLTSSWGLQGWALLRALHDPGGFPLATGYVVFDGQGIGHKSFALLTVKGGALVAKE